MANYKESQDRVEVMMDNSPKGDSQANGDAERAVRSIQGLERTMKDALESAIEAEVPTSHDLMTWLIEHAATIINCFKRTSGGDGLTAFSGFGGERGTFHFLNLQNLWSTGERARPRSLQERITPEFLLASTSRLQKGWCGISTTRSFISHRQFIDVQLRPGGGK